MSSITIMTLACRIFVLSLALAACVAATYGQATGKLKGRVLDNRLTPIIGTTISVFDTRKKFTVSANDDTGLYEIELPPGTYTVRIKARPGFAQFTRRGVVIRPGKTKVLDIFPEARIYAGKHHAVLSSKIVGLASLCDHCG